MGSVPVDGVMTKVYVFVAILAWSRTLFVRFTTDMQLLTWLDCHRRAFEYFGGVTQEVLIDNLLCGAPHKRFYVEHSVMWSSPPARLVSTGSGAGVTPHNGNAIPGVLDRVKPLDHVAVALQQ